MGIQPGPASMLADLERELKLELDDLDTALTMEDGLGMLRGRPARPEPPTEDEPPEGTEAADDENAMENQLDEPIKDW